MLMGLAARQVERKGGIKFDDIIIAWLLVVSQLIFARGFAW